MFKAIFTNSFGILFSRILGFLRDMLMASVLGANIYSDIFFVAFKLPNLFRRIFAEGAFSQTFIPAFTRSHHKGVFSVAIFTSLLSVILVLSLLVTLFPYYATKLIAIGFDEATIIQAAPFVAINFWYLGFIFVVTFIAALLQYKHHFATTAFATALLNIALIGALLLADSADKKEVVLYLSYGVLVGGALQLFVHLIALKKLGLFGLLAGGVKYFSKKKSLISKEVQKFKKEFLPAIWGNSSAQFSAFLDTWLASLLVSGSISYLYYANRVFQLPLALFAIATSVAIFPKVSRYLKNNDTTKALEYMQKAFWFLSFILAFFTAGGVVLSEEVVKLLFFRGAFSLADVQHTAGVLEMYMVGLVFFGLAKLFLLWIYAQQNQKEAAKIATYTLGVNIILSLLFLEPLGAMGLALASSLSGVVQFVWAVKIFGKERFMAFLASKNSIILVVALVVFVIILEKIKVFLDVLI